jgi:hypothetical protein
MSDPHNSQMSEWITDRLPTEAEADSDGDVKVLARRTSDNWSYCHWSWVGQGQPWMPLSAPIVQSSTPEMSERALTTHQLLSRLNDVNQELTRRVQEGLI